MHVPLSAADSEEEAQRLFTTLLQHFIYMRRGKPRQLQPLVEQIEGSESEVAGAMQMLKNAVIGDRATVRDRLALLAEQTGADELILTAQIYDHTARMHSFEIGAQVHEELASKHG